MKVADVVFAATVTVAGTVKADDALLLSVTTEPPAGAVCDKLTMQLVLALEPNEFDMHPSDVTVTATCRDTVVNALLPFDDAVSVAVWFAEMFPAEMTNAAVVDPDATVTDVGTVSTDDALLPIVTTVPPAGAACDNVTMHAVLPLELNMDRVQARVLIEVDCCCTVVCSEISTLTALPFSDPAISAV